MKRYLYFGEATVETTGEAGMFPVDAFLGMDSAAAAITLMWFKARNGAAVADRITVLHTGYTPKQFMTEIVKFMQNDQKNPFLIVADRTNVSAVTNMITSVSLATS